jgi:8-oxo-dGTP pyrophosphatase MutT (NUDIX family)
VKEHAFELISRFDPSDDGEAVKSRDLIVALLADSTHPFSRDQYTPGHITCTGLVFNGSGDSILLVHHLRLNRWLLPGGHVEPEDATLADAAKREVLEETGASLDLAFEAMLVNVDVHPIPPKKLEPLHLHHDLIFVFRAAGESTVCSPESREVRWCGLDEFDSYALPRPIRRALATAKAKHPNRLTA